MRVPVSTYRLQLRAEFGFRHAAGLVPYLADLGITTVYCSPVLQAAPGSTHGYDVVDHSRLSEELGGDAGWAELVAAAHTHGLGIVVDVVPNHMATDPTNRQWTDLLAAGRGSAYAHWFDVDWAAQDDRVLVPVLGEPLADAPVERPGDTVRYYEHQFPASDHYRLAWWRLGSEELNYRRFFDVTSLVAVRVEDPDVFTATSRLLIDLVNRGDVDGLRIDHPDGLTDPAGYLDRLAKETGGAWVVVEKILEPGEALPADWACAGTTGYDALRRLGGVLLDPAGAALLTAGYTELTDGPGAFEPVVDDAKTLVVTEVLAAEVARLTRVAYRVARERRRDLAERRLREALEALLAAFDVYRAYVRPGEPVPPQSAQQLDAALGRALAKRPDREAELRFLRVLAVEDLEFAIRFQQTCGAVMAKGVEDTAFYRWFRLSSLNEVGGSPADFGISVEEFHRDNVAMARSWPLSMTTLTTHDTKRSEDVRARLAVLSEIPDAWRSAVGRWRARCAFRDPNLEYLLWQTLVGAWPIDPDRMRGYLEKASREAKQRTSWTAPDPAYDEARDAFVTEVFADADLLADVERFVAERLRVPGASNTLGQKLLQLAMPGVPDVYQGTEFETLSLVDPDNRRPVDYDARQALLADLDRRLDAGARLDATTDAGTAGGTNPRDSLGAGLGAALGAGLDAGNAAAQVGSALDAAKLLVVSRALRLRRRLPEVFLQGRYDPLRATGPAADHLVGFVRGEAVAALATRLPVGLADRGGWADTSVTLPIGGWRDELTGTAHDREVRLADVFARLPVALLVRD